MQEAMKKMEERKSFAEDQFKVPIFPTLILPITLLFFARISWNSHSYTPIFRRR